MKAKHRLSFVPFILIFTAICMLISLFSIAFCKWETQNTATSLPSPPDPPTIIIDAGHGGEDGGAIGIDRVIEKDLNLQISEKLRDLFNAAGYRVVMTRDTDTMLYDKNSDFKGRKKELDLAKRVEIANSYENAIFLSIHMNSFPQSKYSGLQIYYSKNHQASAEIAEAIQTDVRNLLQPDNNRQKKPAGQNIFVLERIRIPAVLIECGFISNPDECRLLLQDEYQKKLSLTIFLSILEYIEKIP